MQHPLPTSGTALRSVPVLVPTRQLEAFDAALAQVGYTRKRAPAVAALMEVFVNSPGVQRLVEAVLKRDAWRGRDAVKSMELHATFEELRRAADVGVLGEHPAHDVPRAPWEVLDDVPVPEAVGGDAVPAQLDIPFPPARESGTRVINQRRSTP